ncbi:MAG: hypothetical protein WC503_02800 [Candidatus Shapirobacteria bacterium]
MKFLNYLNEALSLSRAKYYTKMYNKELHDKVFKGKNRITIPFKNEEVSDYVDPDISNLLYNLGWNIISYIKGTVYKINDPEKKVRKLIDILNKEDLGPMNKVRKELIKTFTNDPKRKGANIQDAYIVISRHPYDIAGMSTGRGWTSCMNLDNGAEAHYVPLEIKGGTIVAYLVKGHDKNITRPIGRVAIRPFVKIGGSEIKMVVCPRAFGDTPEKNFIKEVTDWVNKSFPDVSIGVYTIDDYKFYAGDYHGSEVPHFGKEVLEIKTIKDVFAKIKDLSMFMNYFPVGTRKDSYEYSGIKVPNINKFLESITVKDAKRLYDPDLSYYTTKLLILNIFRRSLKNADEKFFTFLAKISIANDFKSFSMFDLTVNANNDTPKMVQTLGDIHIPEATGKSSNLDKFYNNKKLLFRISKEILDSIRKGDKTLVKDY